LRHHLQLALCGVENVGINLIAQGSDQPVNPGFDLLRINLFGGASG